MSSGSNSQQDAVEKSQAAAAPGTRSGQPNASAIGSFMSGGWPGQWSSRR
ncbi:1-deoxy-D-xylulose 5-phosphate reductoisomerase domain protein [Mycobacterium xenopi 4042]|uniref:1-deoxy-D-xylulose 5-phosphate reductoisomerase domain protein n=1 Tax=Mycobacterium xenopi 4042 TaxID=1299334 RepID=X8E5Z4_MYCXE|nr:1-deoxy-D-xylulose 5-phosphate reductoisomerase domain protein [Mycobacterium xenopi 4042]